MAMIGGPKERDSRQGDRLGTVIEPLMAQWHLEEATAIIEAALVDDADSPRLLHDLSVLYAQQGLFEEADTAIRRCLCVSPNSRAAWHHFLALQKNNPTSISQSTWRGMHIRFADTMRNRFDALHWRVQRSINRNRRLHIGFLAPDTHQATSRFLGVVPYLADTVAANFAVFAYWASQKNARDMHGQWRSVNHRSLEGLTDEQAAQMTLGDGIDLLIDIAGHGAHNQLPLLALRTAPVQMTWLDYLGTTGLETVDYRITDAVADPPGSEEAHVERLLRLQGSQWLYSPPALPLGSAVLPPLRTATGIVFGSICVPLKLSTTALTLWARLLRQMPHARIRFLGIPEGRARDRIEAFFASFDISLNRIELLGRLPLEGYLQALDNIDVVLDALPFSGATSTLDALWRGRPVVTLAGTLSHTRSGASILTSLGHPEWVATSGDGYLEIAQRVAANRPDPATLRAKLLNSSLCDSSAFGEHFTAAMRRAWHGWIDLAEAEPGPPTDARHPDFIIAAVRDSAAAMDIPLGTLVHRAPQPDVARYFAKRLASMGAPERRTVRLSTVAEVLLWTSSSSATDLAEVHDSLLARGFAVNSYADLLRAEPQSEWTFVVAPEIYDVHDLPESVDSDQLESFDALAPIGVTAVTSAPMVYMPRDHVHGLSAYGQRGQDKRFVEVWLSPNTDFITRCLGGSALLVKTKLLRQALFQRETGLIATGTRELDFQVVLGSLSRSFHALNARMGVSASLCLKCFDTTLRPDAVYAIEQNLELNIGLNHWRPKTVQASPFKLALPDTAWIYYRARLAGLVDNVRAN